MLFFFRLWYNNTMNGYDFDKTILKGNSVCRFSIFCYIRLPYLWLLLPQLLLAVILRGLRIIKKDPYLRMLEWFIVLVPHRERFVKRFWDKNIRHVKQWYLNARKDDDVIISASPAYLIEEACARLNVRCITSPSNKNGHVVGKHCYGEQKVVRFREEFGNAPLETFYSDSMSDAPMLKLAKRGYLVKGDKITLIFQNGERVSQK